MDSFINDVNDNKKALELVEGMIKNAKKFYKNIDNIKESVFLIQDNKARLKKHRLNQEIANYVINEIQDRADFFYNENNSYLFLQENKNIVKIDPFSEELKNLLCGFGINPSEKLFPYIIEELDYNCRKFGKKAEIYKFSHFDYGNYTLYIFNNNDTVFKINRFSIDVVSNGYNNVYFQKNKS